MAWQENGNDILPGSFLGTTNGLPLSLRTFSEERLLIGGNAVANTLSSPRALSIRTDNEERLLIGGGRTLEVRGPLAAGTIVAGGEVTANRNITGENIIARANFDATGSDILRRVMPANAGGNILVPEARAGIRGNLYFGGITDSNRSDQIGMRLFGGVVNRGPGEIHAGFIDVKTDTLDDGLRIRVDTTVGGAERMRVTSRNVRHFVPLS